MKKQGIALILSTALCLSLCACSAGTTQNLGPVQSRQVMESDDIPEWPAFSAEDFVDFSDFAFDGKVTDVTSLTAEELKG